MWADNRKDDVHDWTGRNTFGPGLVNTEALDFSLDANYQFVGTSEAAESLILRADAAIAARENLVIRTRLSPDVATWAKSPPSDTTESAVVAAKAKLGLAAIEQRLGELNERLEFFFLNALFRPAFTPNREKAATCLVSMINGNNQPRHGDDVRKVDLFIERDPAIGTYIMLPDAILQDLATGDGCKTVEGYMKKLIALRGDTILVLPERVRLTLAYPEILRELVRLKGLGRFDNAWCNPFSWAFGAG